MNKNLKPSDISKPSKRLVHIEPGELVPLPPPYEDFNNVTISELKPERVAAVETSLDDTIAIGIPKPKSKEEEEKYIQAFLSGLRKLFEKENNWTFLQPLLLSMEYCARCQTCSDACPVFEMSGRQEIYRPTFRSEVLRRIYKKYLKSGGKFLAKWNGDIDLNWTTIARLAELSYRCTLCRRCASVCPIGVDNGLITHELRKLFSQEMGIAAKELHEKGSVQHLRVGSSTGMNPVAVKDSVDFIQEEMEEITGYKVEIPWDKEGAEVLLIHNAGGNVPGSIIDVAGGVEQRLALRHGRGGGRPVEGVRGEDLGRGLEGRARARGGLEEEVHHRLAAQGGIGRALELLEADPLRLADPRQPRLPPPERGGGQLRSLERRDRGDQGREAADHRARNRKLAHALARHFDGRHALEAALDQPAQQRLLVAGRIAPEVVRLHRLG